MLIAIAHNIRSLHNVGSIFRTADGAGVTKIYLTGITPTPKDRFGVYREQLAKVSLGAERTMSWESHRSLVSVLKKLRGDGYCIFALEQSTHSIPYNKIPKKFSKAKKKAIIVGNEVRGLSPAALKLADVVLEIPMHGTKESLNVSVAFGIAAYELGKK